MTTNYREILRLDAFLLPYTTYWEKRVIRQEDRGFFKKRTVMERFVRSVTVRFGLFTGTNGSGQAVLRGWLTSWLRILQ